MPSKGAAGDLPLATPASRTGIPASPRPTQLPSHAPAGAAGGSPSTGASATHAGDKGGVPGSWPQPAPELAVKAIWGVSDPGDGRALCHSSE